MRSRSLLPLACCVALVSAGLAQETEQFGTVEAFEATDDGGLLVLSGGSRYAVPKAVYDTYRGTISGLKAGASVAFLLDKNGRVARLREVSKDDGSKRRVYSGKLNRVEQVGDRLWLLVDDNRWTLSLEVYKQSELPFMNRGNPIRVVVEKGAVVEVARGVQEEVIKPEQWDRIVRSRRGDDVRINGREYKFIDHSLQVLRASPKLPDGSSAGVETVKLEDVKSFENAAADTRLSSGGTSSSEGDVLAQMDVRVGDTIGLGLDSGQVVKLDDEVCELRVWRNETWGPSRAWKRSEITGSVRRVSLTAQGTTQLQGGEIHLRIHRTRHGGKGGLVFEVEVDHDLADKVLTGAKVRFHLGGLGIVPGSPGERIEIEPVPVLFAGQQARITHRVADESWLDGWCEVQVEPEGVVPLASPGARTHLLSAIGEEAKDLNELTKVYQAAGGNGDEDLLRILVERALYPPAGTIDRPKHAEAALAGLERAGERATRLIVGDLFYLDRNLKRATLNRGELVYEPLNRMGTDGPTYKKELIRLLGRLPGALRGEHGGRVFTLYLEREDLNDSIQGAFAARPAEAVETMLQIATSTHSGSTPEELKRAETAASLLRRLGDAVLDEMLRELRKRDISVVELQAARQQPSVKSGEVVDRALALLVEDAVRRRREQLDQRVKGAAELEAQEKWTEALAVLREILAQDPAHSGALERLPEVLVSLARARRATDRGEAARLLEEASELLPPQRKTLANLPLGELLLEAAREDAAAVVIRATPHRCAARVRDASAAEAFNGTTVDAEWVQVELGEKRGFLRTSVVSEAAPPGSGRWSVFVAVTPREKVIALLDEVRKLSSALEGQANEVEGALLARDAVARFESGDFQSALPLFERARALNPSDPRLDMERDAWIKANMAYLMAVSAVLLVAVIVGLMQLVARPRKVRFSGEFKHYGANRTARERDLDLGEEGGGGGGESAQAAPPPGGATG